MKGSVPLELLFFLALWATTLLKYYFKKIENLSAAAVFAAAKKGVQKRRNFSYYSLFIFKIKINYF
jgi:hypothetical protein